jgi:Rod binding domain-containing protein
MSDFRITSAAQTQSLTQFKGEQAIQDLRNHAPPDKPAKIEKAARDFEAILVGQWLDQAEKSFASVPGTDPDQQSDSSHDQFQSIACQSLAEGLSKTGGFGIAAMISKQLKAVEASGRAEAPAGDHPAKLDFGKLHN